MKPIIVFGSINLDLVTKIHRLPMKGETLRGSAFFTTAGGKGANQAVAAVRLGATTHLVGRLGDDQFGSQLLAGLKEAGVETAGILVDPDASSGVAVITVDNAGENNIIIVAGANERVCQQDVERLSPLLPGAAALLLQFEIGIPAVLAAAQAAHRAGVRVILDPAPAQTELPPKLYPLVDIITPNQVEASQLVGFTVDGQATARQAAVELRRRGVRVAIVKLGDRGVLCATNTETFFIPAFSVATVDTVAAGDAFNGGLAVALAEGHSLREAVIWGAAAGALTTTKAGAQSALPDRATFEAFLKAQGVK